MKIQDMTDEQLKSEYLTLYNQIEINDCYNTQDVLRYELIGQQLEERGYEIVQGLPEIIKKEDEEAVVEDHDRKAGLYGPEYKDEKF
jgi:hypothetical protein